MKLAFCVNWRGGRNSGVYRKVASQVAAWTAEGVEVALFVTTVREAADDWAALPQARAVFQAAPLPAARLLARERAASAAIQWGPDAVYMRHGVAYPGMLRIGRSRPLVVEINGDDVAEGAHRDPLYRTVNRATRVAGLRATAGLVFVTRELSESQRFRPWAKRSVVVANGVDIASVPRAPIVTGSGRRMVFLGHPHTTWHGVDKLLGLAAALPDWSVDLVGPATADLSLRVPRNVTAHGVLSQAEYSSLLAEADVAVGPLALKRAGITEASPLKVREYLAAGLPTVTAYRDTDFPDGADFLLALPNTPEDLADAAARIEAFADKWRGARIPAEAVAHLDVHGKERDRLAFITQCCAGVRSS